MMMMVNGDILLAAATWPPAAAIFDIFKTLRCVRQAELEAHAGVHNSDAWNTGAAEPGVSINVVRELSDIEFCSTYGRWR